MLGSLFYCVHWFSQLRPKWFCLLSDFAVNINQMFTFKSKGKSPVNQVQSLSADKYEVLILTTEVSHKFGSQAHLCQNDHWIIAVVTEISTELHICHSLSFCCFLLLLLFTFSRINRKHHDSNEFGISVKPTCNRAVLSHWLIGTLDWITPFQRLETHSACLKS